MLWYKINVITDTCMTVEYQIHVQIILVEVLYPTPFISVHLHRLTRRREVYTIRLLTRISIIKPPACFKRTIVCIMLFYSVNNFNSLRLLRNKPWCCMLDYQHIIWHGTYHGTVFSNTMVITMWLYMYWLAIVCAR